jgi:DNA-binding response OmpR family regulator
VQASNPTRHLRFGVFEVDLRTGELTKRGLRVRLQDQPFQVLATLLEKTGRAGHPGGIAPQNLAFYGRGL